MDCKKLQEILYDLRAVDEESLFPEAKEHLACCPECHKEFAWLRMLVADFKCLKLPDPDPVFWENMAHRIQTKLMVGQYEEEGNGSWLQALAGWFNRPSFVYGIAAAAVIMVAVMWGVPSIQSPNPVTSPLPTQKAGLAAYSPSPSSIFDPTISRVLESIPEKELSACVTQLIQRSFDRKELATMVNDPVVTVENAVSVDQDIYQLNDKELQQFSSLLSRKFPR